MKFAQATYPETTHDDDRTWREFDSEPDAHWHYTVVNHMQGCDVVILFA
jgi:hypothetical protein